MSGTIVFIGGAVVGYRYFRLFVTDVDGGAQTELAELKIFVGATQYPNAIGDMTTNTAPSPLVASASNENGTDLAWHAFDNSAATKWATNNLPTNQWIKIDLGAGNGITPTSIKITAGTIVNRSPKNATFSGSNTGSFGGEETNLISVTNQTSWGSNEERTFS